MANRIILNAISYHGKGAIEHIIPEVKQRFFKGFYTNPGLVEHKVINRITDLLDEAELA